MPWIISISKSSLAYGLKVSSDTINISHVVILELKSILLNNTYVLYLGYAK